MSLKRRNSSFSRSGSGGQPIVSSNLELREMFNKALNAARNDGTLRKLSIKRFTFDI
jgi:ABC-type amino acid transport substrate-binding protein